MKIGELNIKKLGGIIKIERNKLNPFWNDRQILSSNRKILNQVEKVKEIIILKIDIM